MGHKVTQNVGITVIYLFVKRGGCFQRRSHSCYLLYAARFALKTTSAFNEETKKEKLARDAEENGRI